MIKFIVLFSLALAGHKARGLMLRGSGQILQRPNFINSESQLDAKKSFLQINKNNGKSLLKTNLYLHHDEDKQEQSYLQGKKEEVEKIASMLAQIGQPFIARKIYEGLNRLTLNNYAPADVVDLFVKKVASGNRDDEEGVNYLLSVIQDLSKKSKYPLFHTKKTRNEVKDVSMRILYVIEGREQSIKDQLARIGEEGNAEKIDKGLSYTHFRYTHVWRGYEQFKYLTKLVELVDKRKKGKTSDKKEARECIKKLNEFGTHRPMHGDAEDLTNRIESLVDPES